MVQEYQFDRSKEFPTLANAPIVEAVLRWQASPSIEASQDEVRQQLSRAFPDYELQPQHKLEAALERDASRMENRHSSHWEGFRCQSPAEDSKHVAQFTRNGVVFSRLAPYVNWSEFVTEGTKFWNTFVEILQPKSIACLSVRYISEIVLESLKEVGEYLEVVDDPLADLGVSRDGFFHQDTHKPGNEPYIVRVTRSVQPKNLPGEHQKSLIVDIDVATTNGVNLDEMSEKLQNLRYLKNEMFFGLMKAPEKNIKGQEDDNPTRSQQSG
jgi:uncharacterized protein (TIGR04255 family)